MDKLLQKVLERIKPKEKKEVKEIKEVVNTINSELRKLKIKATAVIGGSFAKNTHLSQDYDCDIFVKFDYSYKEKNISDLLQRALKKFKYVRVHGSRDYFQFTQLFNYEIVPVLNIKKSEQALNVTDASPLHVAWVKKFKKSDEIRLAKAFCKAQEIYGAESYIKGFSGHVLDILVIKYGSFINLLKASQKWKEKEIIDVEKHHKDALFTLNASKTQGPLIVIDPIQKDRNAAAALSKEKCDIFVKKAKEYLKKPSERFFEKHEITIREIKQKNKNKNLILLEITPLEGKRDVVGAKLLKAYEYIKLQLNKKQFKIKNTGWNWNEKECFFWFVFDDKKLSDTIMWEGPELRNEHHVQEFKKIYKKTFVKNGRIWAEKKREFKKPEQLIKKLLSEKYIKEKIKGVNYV